MYFFPFEMSNLFFGKEDWDAHSILAETNCLGDILNLEQTRAKQELFSELYINLDQNPGFKLEESSELITTLTNRNSDLDSRILSFLIPISANFSKGNREVKGEGFDLHNFSHPYTGAEMSAELRLSPRTTYMLFLHDIPEDILDHFLDSSEYGYNLKDALNISDIEFKNILLNPDILHYQNGIPKFVKKKERREKVFSEEQGLDQRKEYQQLKLKVVKTLLTSLEESGASQELISEMERGLICLTRSKEDDYTNSILEAFNPKNYYAEKKDNLRRLTTQEEAVRISTIEVKLLDAIHNINTMGKIDLHNGGGGLDFTTRFKALLKRMYVVNHSRKFLYEISNSGTERIDSKYGTILELHLRLAQDTLAETQKVLDKIRTKYGSEIVRGYDDMGNHVLSSRGLNNKDIRNRYEPHIPSLVEITFEHLYKQSVGAMEEYRKTELFRLTNTLSNVDEMRFWAEWGINFGGVLETVKEQVDYDDQPTPYGNMTQSDKIDGCITDTVAFKAIMVEYLRDPTYFVEERKITHNSLSL